MGRLRGGALARGYQWPKAGLAPPAPLAKGLGSDLVRAPPVTLSKPIIRLTLLSVGMKGIGLEL
jgi:hypothetical protein